MRTEGTSESWLKVEVTSMGSSLQKIDEELRTRCNNSTCSFWLACLLLSNPTCFTPTYQLKSFVESVINKRKSSCHFAWMNGSIAAWMFVHPTNTAVMLDFFLINQKLFPPTSEYHFYYQGRKWNMPDFWNRLNHSLSKVYRFIWSCPRFLLLTCFLRLPF